MGNISKNIKNIKIGLTSLPDDPLAIRQIIEEICIIEEKLNEIIDILKQQIHMENQEKNIRV